ncbi:MAG: tRNA pseudouridine(55) synthase TruB [Deltaproteobacteria bacterium]|nr:tRNA pseudouridine(55) synthase TruB [Deltaproteobacteria bacterium]
MLNEDAFLVLDKPTGLTSQQVVARVKRLLGCRKVGHTGTLDPLATGVLPLALNRATRLIQYLDESRKVYSGEIEFGVETDTLDRDGQITARFTGRLDFSASRIAEVFARYHGLLLQTAPLYSAIKTKGRPLYAYARSGIAVEVPERRIEIDDFELLSWNPPLATFRVCCSRGTYVRSLAADVGRDLGCGARIWSLCREASGPFTLERATSLPDLTEMVSAGQVLPLLAPEQALNHLPRLRIEDEESLRDITHGLPLVREAVRVRIPSRWSADQQVLLLDKTDSVLALARLEKKPENMQLRLLRVMSVQGA